MIPEMKAAYRKDNKSDHLKIKWWIDGVNTYFIIIIITSNKLPTAIQKEEIITGRP